VFDEKQWAWLCSQCEVEEEGEDEDEEFVAAVRNVAGQEPTLDYHEFFQMFPPMR
jgi:hypothetical protein